MKRTSQLHQPRNPVVLAALTLGLSVAGLLAGSYGNSHAQQEPNRQLVQNGSPPAATGKRIALVIGNGAYTSAPPLKNPPNDARDMAATLRALGFDVTNGININQRDMKRLIREFGQKLKTGGSGLFYYAGHGVQSKGRNYLIPVDANIMSEAEVEDSGVDVSLVLNFMDDAQNGLNIVILDACRNNPFSRSFRSASDGLAQVDAPTGTLIAYATAPGRVASDGMGQNGLYTSELLKQMRVPGLSATELFMRVRAEVMKQTGSKQVPWEASSLVGSFYFSGGANSTASNSGANNAAPSETKFDAAAFEYSYWETIKNSSNADDFKAYLEKYPTGQFASLAKNRIKSLDGVTKPAEPVPTSSNSGGAEIAFWDSVKSSTNPEDFRAYLKKYPNGEFAELAKNRLQPLEAAIREKEKEEEAKRIALVYVPPGSFMMGSENGEKDERPVHRVTISQAFYIGRYEVTQAQWQAAMGNNPSYFKNCGGNCPVEMVSWEDAQNFINKLNEGNDGFRYRLPTEAEWEYACRAGTTGDYAGDLDSMAWYDKNSGKRTHPVGTRQPNGFGLYDMHGNVSEWCEDWYHKTYAGAPTDGSAWLGGGEQTYRVLRGGSFYFLATSSRSADRSNSSPGVQGVYGFRVVAVARTQ